MVEQGTNQLNALATHPAVLAIRERLLGDMQIRSLSGNSITPFEEVGREAMQTPSRSARSEQLLSFEDPKQAEILREVLRNGYNIYIWLTQTGSDEFLDEPSFLLTRDRNTQYVDFSLSNPDFDLSYVLYYGNLFELKIDYAKKVSLGRRPRYRSGKVSLRNDMTGEEADIVNFYMQAFLQRHPFIGGKPTELAPPLTTLEAQAEK